MIVGIFGKIAAGKTTFARAKKREEPDMNWQILDPDLIGHELLETPEVREKIVDTFGSENILTAGKIDRVKLRELMFRNYEKLKFLESILHPLIAKRITERLKKARENDENILLVCALPEKIDLKKWCDRITRLSVSRETAWKRVRERGVSRAVFERIWETQE